jgi:hypothetical protein
MAGILSAVPALKSEAQAPDDAAQPEVFVAPVVPIVDRELEIRLFNAPAGRELTFAVSLEGKAVFEGQAVPADDGRVAATWTPTETGFYTAKFDLGDGRAVTREFPVVWTDLYFVTWGVLRPDEIERVRYVLSHAIVAGKTDRSPMSESIPMLKNRGAKLIKWTGGSRGVPKGPLDDETIDRLVEGWSAPLRDGYDGIFMDEFGAWPTPGAIKQLAGLHRAFLKLRKENPDAVIMPANGGALLREQGSTYKAAEAVALLETYPQYITEFMASHSIKQHMDYRIMVARNTDLIHYGRGRHTALILLGTRASRTAHEEPVEPELEDYVRYIKKKAPEMRGIAFYGGRYGTMIETQDRLCLEYYIKPVVDVRAIKFSNYAPRVGEPVDVLPEIHNLGGMTAKGVEVNLFAGRPGTGRRSLVGSVEVERIGCGFRDIEYKGDDTAPSREPEFQELDGNTYAVYPTGRTQVFLARTTRKVTWTPAQKGYYRITAEIGPPEDDQHTILDGALEAQILVR